MSVALYLSSVVLGLSLATIFGAEESIHDQKEEQAYYRDMAEHHSQRMERAKAKGFVRKKIYFELSYGRPAEAPSDSLMRKLYFEVVREDSLDGYLMK